jgi:hypothetical protein
MGCLAKGLISYPGFAGELIFPGQVPKIKRSWCPVGDRFDQDWVTYSLGNDHLKPFFCLAAWRQTGAVKRLEILVDGDNNARFREYVLVLHLRRKQCAMAITVLYLCKDCRSNPIILIIV